MGMMKLNVHIFDCKLLSEEFQQLLGNYGEAEDIEKVLIGKLGAEIGRGDHGKSSVSQGRKDVGEYTFSRKQFFVSIFIVLCSSRGIGGVGRKF